MINYNLANEYIEKLIKLGVTPDAIKQATESDTPHLYMYWFMINGLSDNKEYSVRIITSENYETGADLINGLDSKTIDAIMQDNDYKVIPFTGYVLDENDIQIEVLYNNDQEYDLDLSTLNRFDKRVIF